MNIISLAGKSGSLYIKDNNIFEMVKKTHSNIYNKQEGQFKTTGQKTAFSNSIYLAIQKQLPNEIILKK